MKSKVILFCVLLFCSKFVESSPYSEDRVMQRAYQPPIWPENQNAPGQYFPNTFIRTQNVDSARQNGNAPEFQNHNPGGLNVDGYGYRNNPPIIAPVKESVNYDSPNSQRLNNYPPRDYPRRIDVPPAPFESQNWQSQNPNVGPSENGGNIANKETLSVVPIRNPYQGPAEHQQPKYNSFTNQQYYNGERYPSGEQYYQPQVNSNIYNVNSESRPAIIISDTKNSKSQGPTYVESPLGGNYNGATVIKEVLPNNFENRRWDTYEPNQNVVRNFNQAPIITSPMRTDIVTDELTNGRFNNMNNYKPQPGPINIIPIQPITNSNMPPAADSVGDKSESGYVNNNKEGQSDVMLGDHSRIYKPGPDLALQSNPDKNVAENNYNDAVNIDTVLDKSGNNGYNVDGRRSNAGLSKPVVATYENDTPVDGLPEKTGKHQLKDNPGSPFRHPKPVSTHTKTESPGTLIDSVTINPKIQKISNPTHNNKPRHGPSKQAPIDSNLNQKDQNIKIHTLSVKDILSKAEIESILAGNPKRFVIVHPNKTVEYVDKLDHYHKDSNKYHVINAKQFDDANGDRVGNGTYTTQSPTNVPTNNSSSVVPAERHIPPPQLKKLHSKHKTKHLAPNKSRDQPSVSTLSPIVLYNNTSPKPSLTTTPDDIDDQQSTTYSPVTTTLSPDYDDITTISNTETTTDDVTDVPSTTTTTTTTENPISTTYAWMDEQDDGYSTTTSSSQINSTLDSTKKPSVTTVSPIKSDSVTEDEFESVLITESKKKAKGIRNNKKKIVHHGKHKKKSTQTATNSTHSDVPTPRDDFSPVTLEQSVQNDTNSSDSSTTPDDNSLEYQQSETDIKITLSRNNDSEDEIIAISIEVSGSTDDGDTSDDDVVFKIETPKDKIHGSRNSKKDSSNGTNNKKNNLPFDLANIKGEPKVWVRNTNQDFIQKLVSKNDTNVEVMFLVDTHDKIIIEKDKHTTIFCNGTVVIDETVTTWQYENDPSPKIEKNTKNIKNIDHE